MNIITTIFIFSFLGISVVVECSLLSAASAPVVPVQGVVVDYEDYISAPRVAGAPIDTGTYAKEFIKAVVNNDQNSFNRLFYSSDPRLQRQLARLEFSLRGFDDGDDHQKITPLHVASRNGNLPMVKALVEQGAANVAAVRQGKWTALSSASKAGHNDVVEYLASKPIMQDYGTSLSQAIKEGHLPVVKTLMNNVVYNHHDFDAAIALAHQKGRSEIAKYITDKKAECLQKQEEAKARLEMQARRRSQTLESQRNTHAQQSTNELSQGEQNHALPKASEPNAKF